MSLPYPPFPFLLAAARPEVPLVHGRDGSLYGVANGGGPGGNGTTFRLGPPQAR